MTQKKDQNWQYQRYISSVLKLKHEKGCNFSENRERVSVTDKKQTKKFSLNVSGDVKSLLFIL